MAANESFNRFEASRRAAALVCCGAATRCKLSSDMNPDPAAAPCPCGLAAAYAACCGRWHGGPLRLLAPTPQLLMRSRYSAYVLGLHDYLLDSWHPATRPAAIEPQPPGLRWLGLELRSERLLDEGRATVEFVARSKLGGRAHRLHETSLFERVDGRWLYVRALDR
jgi:SEC-C motif-containing protein